ncbi:mechanosensitive ion channel [Synechococcus sp. Cruz-9H2]|uniref:mechanosensitive ion channel family protein n=1 Tax=unclassified Synechococcus TaxID=2626047 RepID=UPI0020CBC557|nr:MULTISPECIES: mechanosensitive ion channel domain-containing protein [unclassified Synechococcus]MCP9820273.1 mechanosensitive ion channel [Synechococcus sp. Cruz-9H2]MCP9844581.1 mechanosensitive ion channel [Synechococcus sp. Edmonson 11F2]MCP9856703.1 mechanosensitive ion channel [Synechococcus sp. Cruz-9C9]MCP9864087.1 mechanosensitive ion channel [Synechococcus sp. Cruz-7E5]MCP9871282.1 mechanosensitive ion channel [Synechococcus sp. Cruz-7B9]
MPRLLAALLALSLTLILGWPFGSSDAIAAAKGPSTERSAAEASKSVTTQVGSFDTAKVSILGVPAITVAVPVLSDSDGPDAELRARLIENNLRLLYSPQAICNPGELLADFWVSRSIRSKQGAETTGQPACDIHRWSSRSNPDEVNLATIMSNEGLPVLEARFPGRDPMPVLTVTDADSRFNGLPASELADRWRNTLESRLRHAREWLRPESHARILGLLGLAQLMMVALLVALLAVWQRTQRWQAHLYEAQLARQGTSVQLDVLLQSASLISIGVFLVVLLIARSMGALATMALPGQFTLGLTLLLQPGLLFFKILVVAIVLLIVRALANFLLRQWLSSGRQPSDQHPRRLQRYRTLRSVIDRLITLAAGIVLLGWWAFDLEVVSGISASGLLAGGALLGALVFVFQGLLRDFVSGLVVLLEDRYAIGDWIEVGSSSGEVVDIGILSAQFRTVDQQLVVVQHGLVDRLVNHTKLRSGALIYLVLSHRIGSLRQALRVIQQELEAFAAESPWKSRLLDPPMLRAVDAVNPQGIEVSVLIQTATGQQWSMKRELLRRLEEALHKRAIPLATTLEWGSLPASDLPKDS